MWDTNWSVLTKQVGLINRFNIRFIGLNNGLIGYEFGATAVAIVLTDAESALFTTQTGLIDGLFRCVIGAPLCAP